jgi:hypothetical protein
MTRRPCGDNDGLLTRRLALSRFQQVQLGFFQDRLGYFGGQMKLLLQHLLKSLFACFDLLSFNDLVFRHLSAPLGFYLLLLLPN